MHRWARGVSCEFDEKVDRSAMADCSSDTDTEASEQEAAGRQSLVGHVGVVAPEAAPGAVVAHVAALPHGKMKGAVSK